MSDKTTDDHVSEIIHALDEGAMVTKFVLLAEVIDSNGERAIWSTCNDGATAWDNLGLLDYAFEVEKKKVRRDE